MRRLSSESVDVAVIGASFAGLATAIALGDRGRSVVVIDSRRAARPAMGETLPPEIKEPLGELNIWPDFVSANFRQAPGRVSFWGSGTPTCVDHIFNPYGYGWHADTSLLDQVMQAAACRNGASLLPKVRLTGWRHVDGAKWELDIDDGDKPRTISAGLVVLATGRQSSVLRQQAHKREVHDEQIAMIAEIDVAGRPAARDQRPMIEATPDGWFYSVERDNGRLLIAFMTDRDIAKSGTKQAGSQADFFAKALKGSRNTADRLGFGKVCANLVVCAANTYWSAGMAGDRCISVGDAAWTIDPLSGLGIYSACSNGLLAAAAADHYFRDGEQALLAYRGEQRRLYEDMLGQRAGYYAMERRWTDRVFWKRRHAKPTRAARRRE
jgi:flavin-dependent dehydrogenase